MATKQSSSAAASPAASPPEEIIIRTRTDLKRLVISSESNTLIIDDGFTPIPSVSQQVISSDGSWLVCLLKQNAGVWVLIRNLVTLEDVLLPNTERVHNVSLSPLGTYLLTWEKATEGSGDQLKVYTLSTLSTTSTITPTATFPLKLFKKALYPPLKWNADESLCYHMVTNEVRLYDGQNIGGRFTSKLRIPGIAHYTTGGINGLGTFSPGGANQPSKINLYTVAGGKLPERAVVGKSVFAAEEAVIHYSPRGDSALLLTTTSMDTSGDSYYGSTSLSLLHTSPASKDPSISVPLQKEGVVHDAQWCPSTTAAPNFCVISGKMPSLPVLHHGVTGAPLFLFGESHRNTIAWSPTGRFVCLAGFGNLSGGMSFWDRNKEKQIPIFTTTPSSEDSSGTVVSSCGATTRAAACQYGYSPSSRYFMIGTCAPRMNVENGIQLLKYNGQTLSLYSQDLTPDHLREVLWVPKSKDRYPDRSATPPPRGVKVVEAVVTNSSLFQAAAKANPSLVHSKIAAGAPRQAYVPPSQRAKGNGMGGSLAERMRKETTNSVQAGKVKTGSRITVGGKKLPVGMVEETKSKNVIKREKQKAAKARAAEEAEKEKLKLEEEEKAKRVTNATDPVKRRKKVEKLLKQITELKTKDALNEDQAKKVGMEESLREELKQLSV